MKIALRFVEGTLSGQIKEAFLYDKKHVLVGRDTTANIVLPEADRSASTTHAKIVYDRGEIYINDVGSHYGTFVNHKPATRSKIKHGDFIRFGVKGPLAEFLVVPDGQTMATPVVKPAAPVERNAQSATGAPIHKRGRPAATRLMAAPTPEMLAMLAGDVADGVAAAAGAPQAPAQPPPPMPAPRGAAPGGGLGAPVVVLPGPGQGKLPPPMPIPMPVPRPQAAPQQEPPSARGRGQKTQVGMGAMMNPAMRRRLEQQGKLPEEDDMPPAEGETPGEGTATGFPPFAQEDPGPPAVVLPAPTRLPAPAQPAAPPADETKECPFCAERIMKRAIKCRFCGEYLTTTPNKANDPDAPPALDDKLYALPKDARGPAVVLPPPRPVPRPNAPSASPPPVMPSAAAPGGAAPGGPAGPGPGGPGGHKHKPDMQIQRTEMFQAPTEEAALGAPAWGPPPGAPPTEAPAWGPPPGAPPAVAPPAGAAGAPPEADEAPHWDLPPLDEGEQGGTKEEPRT